MEFGKLIRLRGLLSDKKHGSQLAHFALQLAFATRLVVVCFPGTETIKLIVLTPFSCDL
jgi:hypothetical protein